MQMMQSRRRFLTHLSLAGAASVIGASRPLCAEDLPETTTVRIGKFLPLNQSRGPATCDPPMYVAGELLRAEGFTDFYVELPYEVDGSTAMVNDELDFDWNFLPRHVALIDTGAPITILAGVHSGCLELIANDSIQTIKDLKGKRVAVYDFTSIPHILVTLMVAYVGIDPENDIQWVIDQDATAMQLFIDGKIDAFLAVPPEPQELRAQNIGHTVLASTVDRPWSEYFCCALTARTEYVTRYPIATKRVLRAVLKAIDLCVANPTAIAQQLVDRGIVARYDYAIQTLSEVRYDRWREFNAEDSVRFYALRMHEAGFIKTNPNKLIAEHTNWRFLDELKRELKT